MYRYICIYVFVYMYLCMPGFRPSLRRSIIGNDVKGKPRHPLSCNSPPRHHAGFDVVKAQDVGRLYELGAA